MSLRVAACGSAVRGAVRGARRVKEIIMLLLQCKAVTPTGGLFIVTFVKEINESI